MATETMPKILAEALKMSQATCQTGYACHTDSPYSDGYGDDAYGDYGDAD